MARFFKNSCVRSTPNSLLKRWAVSRANFQEARNIGAMPTGGASSALARPGRPIFLSSLGSIPLIATVFFDQGTSDRERLAAQIGIGHDHLGQSANHFSKTG